MRRITGAKTTLERVVQRWVNAEARDHVDGAEGVLRDLALGGCASGMVGDLIYHRDTVKFYKRHAGEIDMLVRDLCADTGARPGQIFRGWDADDPFARNVNNQNILAWFGFEETARRLAGLNGIDC